MTRRRDLADDAAQEGLLRALDRLATYDASRPFAPWLYRIVVNVALRDLEREARGRRVEIPVALPASASSPGDSDDGDDLRVAVLALPFGLREIVVLRYWADLAVEDIAAVLAIPPGTVASRLSRALARLRQDLAEEVR